MADNTSLAAFPSNSSNNGSRPKKYVFSPDIDFGEKITFSLIMFLLSSFAIVANFMILYFNAQQKPRRQRTRRKVAFNRSLTYNFVQSLTWNNSLYAITFPPLFIAQLLVEIVQKEWTCKLVRYLTIYFPTVTLNNLLVIGIERYLAVFHPFVAISNRAARRYILIAWISGGFITLVPAATYNVIRQDIGQDSYTLICKYDKNVPVYRVMILGFTLIVYIIPSFVLTVTSIRIIRYLSQRRLLENNNTRSSYHRLKRTSMFVKLIFSFVIPYFLYVVYLIINITIGAEISWKSDFVIRRCSALMAFSNTVVTPIIFYFSMNGLRRMLRDLVIRVYHFIRRRFYSDMFVVNEDSESLPRTNTDLCKRQTPPVYPEAWKQRKRRNGIGAMGTNVVTPGLY